MAKLCNLCVYHFQDPETGYVECNAPKPVEYTEEVMNGIMSNNTAECPNFSPQTSLTGD